MADLGNTLTFSFEADVSGFVRAVDSAGAKLDALSQRTSAFAAGRPLDIGNGLAGAASDDQAGRELTRLNQQLALVQSTGQAHAAAAEQIRIASAQAKLGADATEAQKTAAATLVREIDAAAVAQGRLRAAQEGSNVAWRYGSNAVTYGIESMIFQGEKLRDVAASLLESVSRAGLSAALSGSGPLAGVLGTAGIGGAPGGLFGALGTLLTGGAGSSAASTFSGLYADGGSIAAGRWGVVGEKGAEIVAGPATVVPWAKAVGQAGRSTQVINFNVTTPDAPSFARSESQMAAIVSRAVARGGRNA